MQADFDRLLDADLQAMACDGATVPQMLREIIRRSGAQDAHNTSVIRALREAFDLSLQEAAPIAGWVDDGSGELSDERLNDLVMSAIIKHRQTWDRQTAPA